MKQEYMTIRCVISVTAVSLETKTLVQVASYIPSSCCQSQDQLNNSILETAHALEMCVPPLLNF